jgi:hypothetical protein
VNPSSRIPKGGSNGLIRKKTRRRQECRSFWREVPIPVGPAGQIRCRGQRCRTRDGTRGHRPCRSSAGGGAAPDAASSFGVEFTDCSELASITTITVAKARSVVPASFTLARDVGGVPFVVRVAHCGAVSIDGSAADAATVAQLGVSIAPPDGTGDIDNYTAWYYTTSLRLALKLRLVGVPAQWVPRLGYDLVQNSANIGTLSVDMTAGHPAFRVTAPVVEPAAATIAFQANWWIQSGTHRTKMSTPIPGLRFGSATATLTTHRDGRLGRLLEGSTETFALLDSYNRFDQAHMTVAANTP